MKIIDPDRYLFDRVKAGDHEAFKELFMKYFSRLCAFINNMLKSQDQSMEVVQKLFVKIWERKSKIEVDGKISSYLYSAVKNEALNEIRSSNTRMRYESQYLDDIQQVYESNSAETSRVQILVNKAIEQLPAKCKQIYELAKKDGLSYGEIADYLDVSEKTVQNQIGIALKKLREILKPQLSE